MKEQQRGASCAACTGSIERYRQANCPPFALNFDDSLKEPVMLPSRYPNLMVNGSTGIAVGMAKNNMVAIAEGEPNQLGLLQLIDYYVAYQL